MATDKAATARHRRNSLLRATAATLLLNAAPPLILAQDRERLGDGFVEGLGGHLDGVVDASQIPAGDLALAERHQITAGGAERPPCHSPGPYRRGPFFPLIFGNAGRCWIVSVSKSA